MGVGARLQPGRQQQRLRPGQRDDGDRLARRRRVADRLRRRLTEVRRAHPALSRDAFLTGRAVRRERPRRCRMARRRRADDADELERSGGRGSGRGLRRAAGRGRRSRRRGDEPIERGNGGPLAAAPSRHGLAHAASTPRRSGGARAPDRARRPRRACTRAPRSSSPEAPRRAAACVPARPALETIDALASAAGIAAEWWDIAGKRTIVSPETKIALLERARAGRGQRGAGARKLDARRRRDAAPPRAASRSCCVSTSRRSRRCATAAGVRRAHRARGGRGRRVARRRPATAPGATLPDGRAVVRAADRAADAADRPPPAHGRRRRMRADGRAAGGLRPERGSPQAVRRRRPALRPAAHGRAGDQGIGDFSTLALAGEAAGGAGAAYLGVSPLHMLFPRRPRPREPLLSLGPPLPRSDFHRRARRRGPAARRGAERRAGGAGARCRRGFGDQARRVSTPSGAIKRAALEALHAAFAARRRRAAGRSARRRPIAPSSPAAARPCGASPPSRRSRRAKRARTGARGREPLRDGDPKAIESGDRGTGRVSTSPSSANGWPTASSRAPRTRAREGAASRSASIATSPSARRRTAPRPGRARGELARGVDGRRAARSVLVQGPELEPAGAQPADRRARRLVGPQRALRRQHAPCRHAAHRPCDGPAAPLPDPGGRSPGGRRLSRLSARRTHRPHRARKPARPMHGRGRGSRHGAEGFRGRMTRANILGMRVLWFERSGAELHAVRRLPAVDGRLRRDPRPRDPRRLVARGGHRRTPVAGLEDAGAGARRSPPVAPTSAPSSRRFSPPA